MAESVNTQYKIILMFIFVVVFVSVGFFLNDNSSPYTLMTDIMSMLLAIYAINVTLRIYDRQEQSAKEKHDETESREQRRKFLGDAARFNIKDFSFNISKKLNYDDVNEDFSKQNTLFDLSLLQGNANNVDVNYTLNLDVELFNMIESFYNAHTEFNKAFSYKVDVKDPTYLESVIFKTGSKCFNIYGHQPIVYSYTDNTFNMISDDFITLYIPYEYIYLLKFYFEWLDDKNSISKNESYSDSGINIHDLLVSSSIPELTLYINYRDDFDHVISKWRFVPSYDPYSENNFRIRPHHKETRRSGIITEDGKPYGIEYVGRNIPLE